MAGSNGVAVDTNGTGDRPKFRRLAGAPRGKIRAQAVASNKTTVGKPYMMSPGTILPPPEHNLNWSYQSLDATSPQPMARLMENLSSQSPEMSKGIWDYLRLLNPGWKCEVFNPGTDTPNARGTAVIQEFFRKLRQKHGSVDVPLGRLHMGAYMRGGYFGEIVFDDDGREALDLATPDPSSVRFRVVEDPATGHKRYQLGQWQDLKFVSLEDEVGVRYIPVDPFPGSPYGRPIVAPAVFCCVFLIGLLHDLRRVISQQGWPRIEISIDTQKLLDNLESDEEASTSEDVDRLLQEAISEVQRAYGNLQPDDAYVHSDEVEIKGPIGVTAGANLAGIESVIAVVERMLVRALKTTPLMMGITDGVSEANANRQWEILIAGIKSLQHLLESMLEDFLTLACQAEGVQVSVKFEFAEIRASEAQRDALTRSQEIDNAKKLYDMGLTDQEETAQELVGHPPAEEEPRAVAAAPAAPEAQPNDTNPEPGTTKGRLIRVESGIVMPSHMTTRAAQAAEKTKRGFVRRSGVRRALIASQGLPRHFYEHGDEWVMTAVRTNDDGIEIEGVYDVFSESVAQH